jgi:hypothetical protein
MNVKTSEPKTEPRGFGEHTRGLSGEYAHQQGWGLDIPERTRQSSAPQDTDGGTDYEYGARDFGDEPVNTALDPDKRTSLQNKAKKAGK